MENSKYRDDSPTFEIAMSDILLVLLDVNNHSPIASRKKLFLSLKYFQEKLFSSFQNPPIIKGNVYQFVMGEWGYWSIDVINDLEMFSAMKIISVRKLEARNITANTFYITAVGRKVLQRFIYPRLSAVQVLIISQLKDMALSNSLQ